MPKTLENLRDRIEKAIGGRDQATRIEAESGKRFTRLTLQRWIDGKTSPPVAELVDLARFLKRPDDYFLMSSTSTDVLQIQKLDVRAAAGGGVFNEVANPVETLDFPRWMIDALGARKARLRLLRARGDSMEPLIADHALMLVDETDRDYTRSRKPKSQWDHPDIFVFLQDGHVRVKRLRLDKSGHVFAISENSHHAPEMLRKADFKALGRVVWWDNRL